MGNIWFWIAAYILVSCAVSLLLGATLRKLGDDDERG